MGYYYAAYLQSFHFQRATTIHAAGVNAITDIDMLHEEFWLEDSTREIVPLFLSYVASGRNGCWTSDDLVPVI